jgi:hypothetical protein
MHIKEDFLAEKPGIEQDEMMAVQMGNHCNYSGGYSSSYDDDPELLTIMEREFGSKQKERERYSSYRKQTVSTPVRHTTVIKENEPKKEYLLVDGYNIIFAWEELNELAKASIDAARNKLMDILSNYQGFIGCTLILVFDAYKVKGIGSRYRHLILSADFVSRLFNILVCNLRLFGIHDINIVILLHFSLIAFDLIRIKNKD